MLFFLDLLGRAMQGANGGLGMIKLPIFGSDFRKGSGVGLLLSMSPMFFPFEPFFFTQFFTFSPAPISIIACGLMKFSP